MLRTAAIFSAAIISIAVGETAWAAPRHSDATDFSSATHGGNRGAARSAPVKQGGGNKNFGGNKSFKSSGGNKSFQKSSGGNKNSQNFKGSGGNKNLGNKNVNNNQNFKGKVNFQGGGNNAAKFKVGPGPANKVAFKPAANQQFVKLGKFNAPLWKSGPKKIWWGNKWKVFVPLTALGVVALGGAYYYPDAYLTVARPYCEGITPDGCRLNWQRVDFEDGEGDWQCVQYCRRAGEAPPPRTVALMAPPPMAQGAKCELSIFSEPNFAGTNATANDEQPRLNEIGWQNQIASVRVASGTWDFFSDPEFTGDTMRLQPGEYGDLGPQWAKHSGSFMCVQP